MNDNQPLAIIAGIALGSYQQSRWRPQRDGWTTRVLPSQKPRQSDLRGIWKRVLHEWASGPTAGVHLLLSHDNEGERPGFQELKGWSCRATWLPRGLSNLYGSEPFSQAIDDFLDFEEKWRHRLRPSLNSPLLLPQTTFSTEPMFNETWNRARKVNARLDNIRAVEHSIARFIHYHRTNRGWCDSRELVFSRGPPHGHHGLPAWRRQKLTFRFPDGFHFDVRHYRDRRFSLDNQEGTRRQFVRYTNVDPHGFLRGGD